MKNLISNKFFFKTFITTTFVVLFVFLFENTFAKSASLKNDFSFAKIMNAGKSNSADVFSFDCCDENEDDETSENHFPIFQFTATYTADFVLHSMQTTHISSYNSITEIVLPMRHKCSSLGKFLI